MITVFNGDTMQKVPVNGTLLESLEKSGVTVESHCRDGFCGACRCKLKSGKVEYTTEPLAFLDDGEVLTCCTKSTSKIEIEVP